MKIDTNTLANLDQSALVALVLALANGEVTQAPAKAPAKAKADLSTCGSVRTISGDPCGTKTKGGRDCGKHKHNDATLARKRAEQESFVSKRREYAAKAKAKGGTRFDNKGLAAALRAVGVTPNGEAWGIAKGHVTEDGMTFEQAAIKVAPDYAG